jgi:hypothetical protein
VQVLVYHRGQGQETISGMFLMEKIDIVLTELFALAIWLVWFAIGVCRMSIDLKSHFRWAVWLARAAAAAVVKVDNGATIDDDEILLQDPEPTVDEPKTRKVYVPRSRTPFASCLPICLCRPSPSAISF